MVFLLEARMERAMKVQEVILRAMANGLPGGRRRRSSASSDRHMRRWRERYQGFGY